MRRSKSVAEAKGIIPTAFVYTISTANASLRDNSIVLKVLAVTRYVMPAPWSDTMLFFDLSCDLGSKSFLTGTAHDTLLADFAPKYNGKWLLKKGVRR